MNTNTDAKILSWLDYGYHISAMANRTTIVDNSNWNSSHTSLVALAFISDEDESYKILQQLNVDFVAVVFGGYSGYYSDDINKMIWMIRSARNKYPNINQQDYFSQRGDFSIGPKGSRKILTSLLYKLCYYKFGKVHTTEDKSTGFDRARDTEIGNKDFELKYFKEVYTTQHWLVRIYKVKPQPNRFN